MYIAKCLALHASGTLTCTNTRAITNDIITTKAVQWTAMMSMMTTTSTTTTCPHSLAKSLFIYFFFTFTVKLRKP